MSDMLDDLEKFGVICITYLDSDQDFYYDKRSFTVLDSKGIKELDVFVQSKEDIYADCLGTTYCSDIKELMEQLRNKCRNECQ